jgi:hypothetical protein
MGRKYYKNGRKDERIQKTLKGTDYFENIGVYGIVRANWLKSTEGEAVN